MALPPPKIGKQEAFLVPPKWDEYIPKKNRHSESVRDGPGHHRVRWSHASKAVPKQFGDPRENRGWQKYRPMRAIKGI